MGPYLRYDGADAMSLLRRISADERPLSVSPFALSVLGSIELERTYKTYIDVNPLPNSIALRFNSSHDSPHWIP
jgi:hypothetical protein